MIPKSSTNMCGYICLNASRDESHCIADATWVCIGINCDICRALPARVHRLMGHAIRYPKLFDHGLVILRLLSVHVST